MQKPDIRRLRRIDRTLQRVLSSPYKYKNRVKRISLEESILIDMTCKDLRGQDGEIDNDSLKEVWLKIKARIKSDLVKGNHNNKLLQKKFIWNEKDEFFAELTIEETGLFSKLIKMYEERYKTMPFLQTMQIMVKTVLRKFQEI